ncbi:hypothetical protein QUC32_23175 [Novosphingobium resinovorum]|uniref:hypothetical protein n=1 Tax=Novosphingobium TaxID=165696 RepID=UPI001B3C4CC5|nr:MULTISPECIES: hypothetical protein [Novosphingobium]MBF7012554.1 hypothetical protein [Novosphingobium sp. HR1a]WJM27287.1 hypothetical protein QUC32_23175 [Novosphingobium resinovorum]
MPRFSVPMTILVTLEIDAPDQRSAIEEAIRFKEAVEPSQELLDGWSSVSASHPVWPTAIHRVAEFSLEDVGSEAVQEIDG